MSCALLYSLKASLGNEDFARFGLRRLDAAFQATLAISLKENTRRLGLVKSGVKPPAVKSGVKPPQSNEVNFARSVL
jgi:hypothetical protein